MKRLYMLLHVVAIPVYLLITYLAFVMLLPAYFVAVFGGYDLWRVMVERQTKNRIPKAVAVGAIQALAFSLMVLLEFKLFEIPVGLSQLHLVGGLGAFMLAGFVLVSLATTLVFQRRLRAH